MIYGTERPKKKFTIEPSRPLLKRSARTVPDINKGGYVILYLAWQP